MSSDKSSTKQEIAKEAQLEALEKMAIKSIKVEKEIIGLDEEQSFSFVVSYKANSSCEIKMTVSGSDNCQISLPLKISLPPTKKSKKVTGKILPKKSGPVSISLSLAYQKLSTSATFEFIILPKVSVLFKAIPEEIIKTKEKTSVEIICKCETNGGNTLPLRLEMKDGKTVRQQLDFNQDKLSMDYSLPYQSKTAGFKTIEIKIYYKDILLTKTKAPKDILVYSSRNLPKELVAAEVFIGRKPCCDIIHHFVQETAEDQREKMRLVIKHLKKVCYYAFSLPDSNTKIWKKVSKKIQDKSKAAFLFLVSFLPIKQPLIIFAAENHEEEFLYKSLCQQMNDFLANKKIQIACVTQTGYLAQGTFREYFVEEMKTKKKVIPIVLSTILLDQPKLLAKLMEQLVQVYQ